MKGVFLIPGALSLVLAGSVYAQAPETAKAAPKAEAPKKAAAPKGTLPAPAAGPKLESENEKTIYTLGMAMAKNVSVLNLTEAEVDAMLAGFKDEALHRPARVPFETYQPKINDLVTERRKIGSEAEKAKGDAYAAKIAAEPGAQKKASGLVFQSIAEGKGEMPKATDTVKVHYRGKLVDGTEFDSSYKRNEPAKFPLNGVIPCWTEGVQLIKVGGKARLVCPAAIAYGEGGRPGIPGNATLDFEVELLSIEPPPAPAAAAPAPATAAPATKK